MTIAASGGMVLEMGTVSMCLKGLLVEVDIKMLQVSMACMIAI